MIPLRGVNELKKILLVLILFSVFSSLSAVDFDAYASKDPFKKGHSVGLSLFPVYQGQNTLLEIDAYATFSFDPVAFGLLIPVRFLLHNKDDVETTGAGAFPKDDWDEARDWISWINFFQYGHKDDLFYFYFGEQENRYIGNGSILGAYYNSVKLNFPKRGVDVGVNTDYAGFDLFMDDVSPPNIIGGRAYVKPFSFLSKECYANNIEIGGTYLLDVFSPYTIANPDMNTTFKRDVDRVVDVVWGIDISMRFVATEIYQMRFYTDFNTISEAGSGFHFGIDHSFDLPTQTDMKIKSRWEYRLMEANYIPQYFNTFYDVEREYYRNGETKSFHVGSKAFDPNSFNLDWNHGYYFDLVFDLTGTFSVGGSFEHNRIYDDMAMDVFNSYQVNIFTNARLFEKFGIDFVMTFQNVVDKDLKKAPFFKLHVQYFLNEYFTVGFQAESRWYLRSKGQGQNTDVYYDSSAFYSLGGYGAFKF